jgi:hypothetical protein
MKKVTVLLSLCALVLAFAPAALADWDHPVKWDQLDPISGSYAWAQLSSQITADDFLCDETGWITDIEIIGDPFAQLAGAATLRITFWDDVPATDTVASHPGDILWDITIGPADAQDPLALGWKKDADYVQIGTESKIKIDLPEEVWFHQEQGNIYWIAIQGPPGFQWAARNQSAGHQLDDAVTWAIGAPTWQHYAWNPTNGSLTTYDNLLPAGYVSADLCFRLTGTVPEPASIALVTLGGVVIALLRRRKSA